MKLVNSRDSVLSPLLAAIHSRFVMNRRIDRIANVIIELLPKSCTVLDVGSGNGKLAASVMKARSDVVITGVDTLLWPEQEIATTKFNGRQLPMKDGEVDICMASDVLHHCEDPMILLSEMVRVASVGIIVKDHIADGRFSRLLLCAMDWAGNRGYGVELVYNYWDWEMWESTFQQLGLELGDMHKRLGLYPSPLSWLLDGDLHFVAQLQKKWDCD